jgi:hypothetical protein
VEAPEVKQGPATALPGLLSIALAAAIWLPSVHLLFRSDAAKDFPATGLSPYARKLAARHLALWTDAGQRDREIGRMRRTNSEWDFMGRCFLVWSLADMSLRDPGTRAENLAVMDTIISETLKLEREEGITVFLMPYALLPSYEIQPARSLFLDGEIAMMLAVRRLVEERPGTRPLLDERIAAIVDRMERNPLLAAESYPDECWTFDHVVALGATRIADYLDGTDHGDLRRRWVTAAKARLLAPQSGLLVSSYSLQGIPCDGPEGSTIWMTAYCLRLIDETFARDQYARAKRELAGEACGFGYSREWPRSWQGPQDVDSGAVIPGLGIGAAASGMAFIGAAGFRDGDFLSSLKATLDFAAFPSERDGCLRYCGSNQVGDAALLYAATLGPVWERVLGRTK